MKSIEMDMDIQTVRNLYVSGMNQFLCHITNWSGNERDMKGFSEIRKQIIELTNMNECKSFLRLTVRCSVKYMAVTSTYLCNQHPHDLLTFTCMLVSIAISYSLLHSSEGNVNLCCWVERVESGEGGEGGASSNRF